MRDIARRSSTPRRFGVIIFTAIAAAGGAAAAAAPVALGATLPPTISSGFTPGLIGVGGTSAIGFTVTDPNASGTLSNISFTDTLGGSALVDNPNGLNTSGCGSNIVVTANPGTATIGVSAGTVKAGTPCVISIAVTSATAEAASSQTTVVSSSAGNSSSGAAAALAVLAAPTVTVATPASNARYRYGQSVRANFSCVQAAYALGLEGCTAQDDLGNTITPGGLLDTKVPGQHQLTVQAFSISGLVTDDTIDYTVLPDNAFTLKGVGAHGGGIRFKLVLPGAGRVTVTAQVGRTVYAVDKLTIRRKQTVDVALAPDAAGAALLAKGAAHITLKITFTPKGGVGKTVTRKGITVA